MSEIITPKKTTVLTLNILASDILENDYGTPQYCPITRALARAGRPDLYDGGRLVKKGFFKGLATIKDNLSYLTLTTAIIGMYATKDNSDYEVLSKVVPRLPIEDFEITITFEE